MAERKKTQFNQVVDQAWPKTKQELEKGLKTAKKIVEEAQKHIKAFSQQGLKSISEHKPQLDSKKFHEMVDKVWPKTKVELEKGIEVTKKLIDQGQKNLKTLSDESVKNTKKLSLSLKREKLYHDLGKVIANMPEGRWSESEKVREFINRSKELEQEIKKLK